MRELNLEELKKYQIGVLNAFADFCDNNNINYWLDGGTLIGAVRHKGYIPWDDDIDVGMLREDYDKFAELFNKQSGGRYKFDSNDLNPDFYLPYGKLMDTDTILYEPDEKGDKSHVNIDVFVYDNAPEDNKEVKKMFRRRDLYQVCRLLRIGSGIPSGGIARRVAVRIGRVIVKPFKRSYFTRKIAENSHKYKDCEASRIGNFMGIAPFLCNKDVFSKFIDAEFEGRKYKIPVGYDELLTNIYGDYMQLPPVEKRVAHHTFKAYEV